MDFDESKSKPPSARTILYNQVKEQSDLCDVTIKYGLWEKNFHWCVLVASPFFENIRKHSYRERNTGIVAMNVGTPASLEEAILYVYGKKPNIKSCNVAALLEIAEYLIIPGLKAKCVLWIRSAKVTDENCLDMIKLASLYEFSLSSYEEYLKGRLPDLMQVDAMLDLTADSVEYILTDADLSYVKASDKFTFLIRWTKSRQQRKSAFEQFLKHIDFADMEINFVTNVVMNEPLIREQDASSHFIAKLESLETLSFCEILLFPSKYKDNKLSCYDMSRRRWCSLNIESEEKRPNGFYNSKINKIEFVRGKDGSEAYIYEESYNRRRVYIINFENNSVKQSAVKDKHSNDTEKRYSNEEKRYIQDDELILIYNHKVEYRRDKHDPEEQPALPVELLHMYMCASHPFDRALAGSVINSQLGKRRFSVSQLNVGKIESDETSTVPILSLKGDVTHVCANKTTIAMLQCNAHLLYIYNRKECSLETIDLNVKAIRLEGGDKIAEAGESFFIYNNERLISIAKQIGPSLLNNYLINVYKWLSEKPEDSYLHKYYFCENRWYHYYQKRYVRQERPIFETTTHAKMIVAVQDQEGIPEEIWEDLPVCEAQYGGYEDPGSKIFQIKVSKEKLSCAFNCPHCKLQKAAERRTYRNADDDDDDSSLYDDDSDEYFGNDGGYCYGYYDSDDSY